MARPSPAPALALAAALCLASLVPGARAQAPAPPPAVAEGPAPAAVPDPAPTPAPAPAPPAPDPAHAAPAPAAPAIPWLSADGRLDAAGARALADLSLACIDRPFPNKPSHVYDDASQVRAPREDTPAFYGCFDHHSAVHGHWALVRVLRSFPSVASAGAIRAALDRHLQPDLLARELAFFRQDRSRTFERPYGWGWILRLSAELRTFDDPDARFWATAVDPLARHVAAALADYLSRLSYPIREGVHPNTAYALAHAWDYAKAVRDRALRDAVEAAARRFFLADAACPVAWEPSGEDFLSPCLAEADLMRRVLSPDEFPDWLSRFLPGASAADPAPALRPPEVRDRRDPRIGHLVGLDLHRAAALLGIASGLADEDPRVPAYRALADLHREAGLRQMADSGYGGEHWLASFALYLLTGSGR